MNDATIATVLTPPVRQCKHCATPMVLYFIPEDGVECPACIEKRAYAECVLWRCEQDQDFRNRLRTVLGVPEVEATFQQGAVEMRERAAQTAFEMRGVPDNTGRKIESAILDLPVLPPQDLAKSP